MAKIVLINASPRIDGNTAKAIKSYLKDYKHEDSRYYDLIKLKLNHCLGMLKCESYGKCIQNDSWKELEKDLKSANKIVIGTPVYMGQESALLKIFLERCRSFLSYIEAIDKNSKSIEELFKNNPDLMKNWPEPVSRITLSPEIIVIITQSQPDKNKYKELANYLKQILSKVFNTNNVHIDILTNQLPNLEKEKINKRGSQNEE